jgi:hypothetical protein
MTATIRINWMKSWANSPRIIVEGIQVPNYPSETDPIWEKTSEGLHLARKGDFAFYFVTDGKPTDGYDSRRFAGTFKDGTTFEYMGAWSSRAACVNAAIKRKELAGDYIVDVVCGYYCHSAAVELSFIDRLWNTPVDFVRKQESPNSDNFTYEPAYKGLFKGDNGFEYPPEE